MEFLKMWVAAFALVTFFTFAAVGVVAIAAGIALAFLTGHFYLGAIAAILAVSFGIAVAAHDL